VAYSILHSSTLPTYYLLLLIKGFKQEYSDLMKQKNKIQSIKSAITHNVIKPISPKINSKSIESSNINLYSSDEFSISNLTELSSNNTIEQVEIYSNTLSDSNLEICKYKYYKIDYRSMLYLHDKHIDNSLDCT